MKPIPLPPQARRLFSSLSLLALAAAAQAQVAPDAPAAADAPLQLAQINRQVIINDGGQTMEFAFDELGSERVIKGAPYCAEGVHETVQWLPDASGGAANRIVRQQSTRLCRDGEGRTRQEVERNGRKVVYLRDPLARESWILDPERKSARRMGALHTMGDVAAPHDASAWREYSERMREWARSMADRARSAAGAAPTPPTPPAPPAPPTPPTPPNAALAPLAPLPPMPVAITRSDVGAGGRREVEVKVVRIGPDSDVPLPAEWAAPPPAVQWRAASLAPRGAGSVSPLGSKDIEGVRANGERTTWTIEAGKLGNEKPIVITREIWTSPELMVTVMSRDFDPRSGEVSYRLKNLKRGEPDALLMRVPADYSRGGRPPAPKASGPTG
jgi:hypothetical protein